MSLTGKTTEFSHPTLSPDPVRAWAMELGFSGLAVVPLDAQSAPLPIPAFQQWLDAGFAGDMGFLHRNMPLRQRPEDLLPKAQSILMVTMPYLPIDTKAVWREREQEAVRTPHRAVISVYARGRDYHKVIRRRLMALADRCTAAFGGGQFRACVDSAPLMEVELAERAGLGWRGKNTLLLSQDQGSMFFLGALLTDLRFAAVASTTSTASTASTTPTTSTRPVPDDRHCGSCTACIDLCPTRAFVGPYRLDARRCISYLTIEHDGDIPEALRPLIGNRVYGCDDCQRVCPWNRFAQGSGLPDFAVRHGLDNATLTDLFAWSEQEFRVRHQGSAILRIGYTRWLRNLAVGLGNALASLVREDNLPAARVIRSALLSRRHHSDPMVVRHVAWALAQGEKV